MFTFLHKLFFAKFAVEFIIIPIELYNIIKNVSCSCRSNNGFYPFSKVGEKEIVGIDWSIVIGQREAPRLVLEVGGLQLCRQPIGSLTQL